MALPPEIIAVIEKGLDARDARADGKDVPAPKMHIAIAGPEQSGRETLASDYCGELIKEGLAPGLMVMMTIDYQKGQMPENILRVGRDSMLVFTGMTKRGPNSAEIDATLAKALQQSGPPVVVMIGSEKYLKDLLPKIQPAGENIPLVVTPRAFTGEEQKAFNKNKMSHEGKLAIDRARRRKARNVERDRLQKVLAEMTTDKPIGVRPPLRLKPPRP